MSGAYYSRSSPLPLWGSKNKKRVVELGGLEPPTFCLPDKRSPSELQPRSVPVW